MANGFGGMCSYSTTPNEHILIEHMARHAGWNGLRILGTWALKDGRIKDGLKQYM